MCTLRTGHGGANDVRDPSRGDWGCSSDCWRADPSPAAPGVRRAGLRMRTAAVLLVVALAACSSATTAPQQAVAPEPTVADTTTPSARSTVPAATVPAFMTVTGIVTWNHQPQQGVAVEVSELGAPGRGPGLGSDKTAADGSFSVRFAPGRRGQASAPSCRPMMASARLGTRRR